MPTPVIGTTQANRNAQINHVAQKSLKNHCNFWRIVTHNGEISSPVRIIRIPKGSDVGHPLLVVNFVCCGRLFSQTRIFGGRSEVAQSQLLRK